MRSFDAPAASCTVYTFREGLLASVGHDLRLLVTRLTIEVTDDDAIHGRFAADSLRVDGQVSAGDRRTIEKQAAHDVLDARRFPEIVFRSTRVTKQEASAQVEGELTLHGVTRPLAFEAHSDGKDWIAEIALDQRAFGIKPFSAMLGTLRVRPDVRVRVTLPAQPSVG